MQSFTRSPRVLFSDVTGRSPIARYITLAVSSSVDVDKTKPLVRMCTLEVEDGKDKM